MLVLAGRSRIGDSFQSDPPPKIGLLIFAKAKGRGIDLPRNLNNQQALSTENLSIFSEFKINEKDLSQENWNFAVPHRLKRKVSDDDARMFRTTDIR